MLDRGKNPYLKSCSFGRGLAEGQCKSIRADSEYPIYPLENFATLQLPEQKENPVIPAK
jgi:hypothetical protein